MLLAIYIAIHSSIKNIDNLTEIYNRISKENTVSLHRTKCSLLIKKVITPTILNDLLYDLKYCFYSLIIDENMMLHLSNIYVFVYDILVRKYKKF